MRRGRESNCLPKAMACCVFSYGRCRGNQRPDGSGTVETPGRRCGPVYLCTSKSGDYRRPPSRNLRRDHWRLGWHRCVLELLVACRGRFIPCRVIRENVKKGHEVQVNPYLRAAFPGLGQANIRVSPADEMYLFILEACGGDRIAAFDLYFQSGIESAHIYQRVLENCFPIEDPPRLVLDFASGYGRVSRFLPAMVAEDSIWVADILEPAVVFQTKQFGFNGFVSSSVPEELTVTERFDAIFVWSLFTHLPGATFTRWLRALFAQFTSRGVLFFTTRGSPLAEDSTAGVGDILFEPVRRFHPLRCRNTGDRMCRNPTFAPA
jgi:hypothetical protein